MASAHPSWFDFLAVEAHKPYFSELRARVVAERERFEVYPPPGLVMSAFSTPLGDIRAVIVGQDPYHGPGQAHGLAFSVPDGVAPPPSLRRIVEELCEDVGPRAAPRDSLDRPIGNLTAWGQNVLMLNACLTVRRGEPGSHRQLLRKRLPEPFPGSDLGWETFTAAMLRVVTALPQPIAWLAWGGEARGIVTDAFGIRLRGEETIVQRAGHAPHLILTTGHPSPLSTGGAFAPFRGSVSAQESIRARERARAPGVSDVDWRL
jgi:uracil-DNA glycosylase